MEILKLPPNPGGALTISPDYLGEHEDGWIIKGEVKEDYYEWVNDFYAGNTKTFDWVYGNFEEKVYASSQEAYNLFIKKYPPTAWDYGDI